jgi:hypothetical protein
MEIKQEIPFPSLMCSYARATAALSNLCRVKKNFWNEYLQQNTRVSVNDLLRLFSLMFQCMYKVRLGRAINL